MKTVAEKLRQDIDKILADYAEDVTKNVDDLAGEFAKKGAKAVRASSAQAYGAGRYSKGWTSTVEKTRVGTTAIIYNRTPGLPHLLEKGHAKRNGGRVEGKAHIAPVEKDLVDEYTKAVTEAV